MMRERRTRQGKREGGSTRKRGKGKRREWVVVGGGERKEVATVMRGGSKRECARQRKVAALIC